jgi:3-dehydroquinate synthase
LKKIIVKTSLKSYAVLITNSKLYELARELIKNNLPNNLFVVVDENVFKYHSKKITEIFKNFPRRIHYYHLPSGERYKSESQLKNIYNVLLKNHFGRDTTLIAFGGGVAGDLAAYAASTYMRGLPFVNVPTTLLAMIDSAIGGKTGMNFGGRKNIIGTFYQPELVFIDTMFLDTLPSREFSSALGELIKYGLISNKSYLDFLINNFDELKSKKKNIIDFAVRESVQFKAGVVSQDEFETKGIRKILNLGHTFAHGFESELKFKLKHGEAVTAGLVCALYLSDRTGLLKSGSVEKLLKLPVKIKMPKQIQYVKNESVYEIMKSDKKVSGGELKFVLISDIGKTIVDVSAGKKDIFDAIKKMKKFFSI